MPFFTGGTQSADKPSLSAKRFPARLNLSNGGPRQRVFRLWKGAAVVIRTYLIGFSANASVLIHLSIRS
jgi:hypothetical protein